jgi:L-threonylcarbamoyladenylate synthase
MGGERSDPGVAAAIAELNRGNLVAFPTETVYGLGADAANAEAVAKIFALKGRPADHPLIVHLASVLALEEWAVDVPDAARRLAAEFWPGPLTLILRKASHVPAILTGGQDTVGIRCPSHPVAQSLLRGFARHGSGGVAAPSANRFGHVSPTTAQHVREEFGPGLLVLDGGACEVGLESTIVDLSRGVPVLLRPGAVTREQIGAVTGVAPRDRDAAAPRASGTLAAHYAPHTPLVLVDTDELAERVSTAEAEGKRVAVLSRKYALAPLAGFLQVAPADATGYGQHLYADLRILDAKGADLIVVERPPRGAEWEAIHDRLARAAAGTDECDET